MKIKVTTKEGKNLEFELTTCCHWDVREGRLFNLNTGRFEAVEGDIAYVPHSIPYEIDGFGGHVRTEYIEETVKGYTCYQMIETDKGPRILDAEHARKIVYSHKSKVEMIEA